MVVRKTHAEIARMAEAGAILAEVHELLAEALQPGMTTAELDRLAEAEIRRRSGRPAFKGYASYPATLNTSVNEQIVHAIPSESVRLRAGDVLSIDCGVVLGGYYSDSACTWVVGGEETVDEQTGRLIADTREALWRGICAAQVGARVGDISAAIGEYGRRRGYGVVYDHDGRALGGHGIGRQLWEGPSVPGRGRGGRGLRLKPGLVLAIEPMFTLGADGWTELDDGWTVVTLDGSLSAHWEHTVALTPAGPWVLTARSGESAWPTTAPDRESCT
jgi:methionyl aminopeptidase